MDETLMEPMVLTATTLYLPAIPDHFVLGLDISMRNIGWAIARDDGEIVRWGHWELKGTIEQCCYEAQWRVADLKPPATLGYTPGLVLAGVEAPVKKFFETAVKQIRVSGAALAGLAGRVPAIEVSPLTAKKRLTGSGKADKRAMIAAASQLVGNAVNEHTADAIAIALVAADRWKTQLWEGR